jgi:ABC-type branched-subunit amino acid transport system substrate-binding protein
MRRTAAFVALGLVVLASACGSRASQEQRAAAGVDGSARSSASAPAVSSDGGDSSGASPAASVGDAADAPSSAGAGTASEPAGGDAGTVAASAPAPARGNGGATEIGVTADTITVGLVTTLSGPIPGIFQGAVVGAQAFAAYVNSQGGIYGRKLVIKVADDQFDANQYRASTQELATKSIGFMGSFSLYDDTPVPELEKAGVPDIGYALQDRRRQSPVNFSPQPAKMGTFRTGPFLYYGKRYPDAVKAVGTLYGDVPAAKGAALDSMAAAESVGWRFTYERAYQPTETDFTADVIRMRQAGVKAFYSTAADPAVIARLLKTMEQQGLELELFAVGANGYDPALMKLAGGAAEGVFVDQQLALYQGGDAAAVPEVALMNRWVQTVKPGFTPVLYTAYSWASGRMLEQALKAAGPQLTRPKLLAALRSIDQFDANGLVAPAGPASKRQPSCSMYLRIQGGRFVRVAPQGKGFICEGSIFTRR